jgi:GxxExxY protein
MRALEWELVQRGHRVAREVAVRIGYKHLDLGFQRMDVLVDDCLVVEGKSSALLPEHASRQIYNYLRASNLEVGLLLHFGPKPVFHRVFCRPGKKKIPSMPTDFEHASKQGGREPVSTIGPAENP